MKFKLIFILFSLTMLLFLAILIFLPSIMLGSALTISYWRTNWPMFIVLFLLFFTFVVYYLTNRRLFLLLEKEDWPALVHYLEERVIQKGKYSPRLVRLLANSYLVLSESDGVINLERKILAVKPALIDDNALIFGTARILGRDIPGALRFFELRKDKVKPMYKEWMRWYYGFALLLDRRFEDASSEFSFLAQMSKDGVISALSCFFLSESLSALLIQKEQELRDISSAGRERVLRILPKIENWRKEVTRLSSEIHAAAISKYLDETGNWLYHSTKE